MIQTTNLTIAKRKKMQLERHYAALERLAVICGIENPNGLKLSCKLLSIERQAHRDAERYCNGNIGTDEFEALEIGYLQQIKKLFQGKEIKGLFINGDARGYALKINDELLRPNGIYHETGLQTDWGGYGLLAPEINGK